MKWYKKIGKFFAILISIIYSILLVSIIIMYFMASFFKGNIYVDVLKSIDLKEVKLSDIDSSLVNVFGKDVTLEEAFVSSLESAGINGEVAKDIINNEEIKEVVGEFVGDCVNYTINQESLPEISEKDVEIILDNIDVQEITDIEINKEEIMEYVDEINKNTKDYLMEGFNYAN